VGLNTICRGNLIRPLEQSLAFGIEIANRIGLQSISKDPEHQMAGEIWWRFFPEDRPPPRAKLFEIEIARARDLDL
jgi:hypothetical protein